MFGWFKSKPKELVAMPSNTGLFSTDVLDVSRRHQREPYMMPTMPRAVATYKASETGLDSGYMGGDSFVDNFKTFGDSGDTISDIQLQWYASQGFIGYQVCAILAQHWFIDKACTMPGKDAVRNGYEITVNDGSQVDPKVLDYMRKADKRFKIKKHAVEFTRFGKIFGIRIAMFVVNSPDPDYYKKPFNIDGILPGSYCGISQIDPYWVVPELISQNVQDASAQRFYEPTFWRVAGRIIHYSHLCIFTTGAVADVLKPAYNYGGVSIPQKVFERVYASERTTNEAPMLAMTKRLTVLNLEFEKATLDPAAFAQKMMVWTQFRDNFGVKVAGLDEKVDQHDTALGDMDNLIMTQWQIACSIVNVPGTKMLGTQPKGFNSTGEFEESSYHEELESLQENDLSPLIERHHQLVIKSEVCPKFNCVPFETTIVWNALDAMTAVEKAQLNLIKSQTDEVNVAMGAIDGADVRARIIADPDSGYNGIKLVAPPPLPGEQPSKVAGGGPAGQHSPAALAAPGAAGQPASYTTNSPVGADPVSKPARPPVPNFKPVPGA
jgi:phage-related protein (TIGR01555 family)